VIIYRAVIPTNSLALIHEKVDDKLDPFISYMKASATSTDTVDKLRPHINVRVHKVWNTKCYVKFNHDASKEVIDLGAIIESITDNKIMDVWVHDLKLRFRHDDLGPFDFVFKNRPITPGTDAERYVEKYLTMMRKQGFISKLRMRHLPLMTALSIPEGANLDRIELESREFVKWLSNKSFGLVKLKTMERVSHDTYRDVSIVEAGGH
jgi:hypothetical protein